MRRRRQGAAFSTVIENGARVSVEKPSSTLIVTPAVVPASAMPGVPVSAPVAESNSAHAGMLAIVKAGVGSKPGAEPSTVGVKA